MISCNLIGQKNNPMKTNAIRIKIISISLILLSYTLPVLADENVTAATAVVENLHAALIHVMQNADSLDYQGRFDYLAPIIESNFNTGLIAKVVLSRYWNELTPEQKAEFIALFNQLSTSTYASRFDNYSGESFNTHTVKQLKKGRLLVKTEMVSPGEEAIHLDYLVQETDGKWNIISVIAEGVNDLSLKRAEYASIIKNDGYNILLENIKGKISQNEEG